MVNLGFLRAGDIAKTFPNFALNDTLDEKNDIISCFNRIVQVGKFADNIEVNQKSEAQFKQFIRKSSYIFNTPSFFVNAFNNIELTWRNEQKEMVDLQFLGDGQVQFVIFSKRFNEAMTRVSGRESETRIEAMIAFYGLEDLVYAASN